MSAVERYISSEVWAIDHGALRGLAASAAEIMLPKSDAALRPYAASPRLRTNFADNGSIAVIPIHGMLSYRPDIVNAIFGGSSILEVADQVYFAINNPAVKSILLDIDSPGGTVMGVSELANQLFALRNRKPITAMVNSLAASAAYWLAASCSEIVVTPSAQLGSIGVFTTHCDQSQALEKEGIKPTFVSAGKYKVEGNSYAPLGSDAKAAMQSMVDEYYDMFTHAVARGRNTSVLKVTGGFGQGRLLGAKKAVESQMADRIQTMDQALRSIVNNNRLRSAKALAAAESVSVH